MKPGRFKWVTIGILCLLSFGLGRAQAAEVNSWDITGIACDHPSTDTWALFVLDSSGNDAALNDLIPCDYFADGNSSMFGIPDDSTQIVMLERNVTPESGTACSDFDPVYNLQQCMTLGYVKKVTFDAFDGSGLTVTYPNLLGLDGMAAVSSVTSGVQQSMQDFGMVGATLLGVPIAFAIGGYLIDFIKRATRNRRGFYSQEGEYLDDQEGARERYNLEHKGITDL